jgi:NifU-like protein
MWDYTERVKDYFLNPRNVGDMPDANGIGDTGSLRCGDAMKLYIKVEEIDGQERIARASFQTFGCASAIASASALTEMAIGLTLEEAEKITNDDIVKFLGGLPTAKIHCSVMGAEALHAAIANYRGEEPDEADPEARIVCKCFEVTEQKIRDAVHEHNLTSVEQVTNYTKAGGACGECKTEIARIIGEVLAEKARLASADAPASEREAAIRRLLEEQIAPALGVHGGGLQLLAIEGNRVVVVMTGACSMCAGMNTTVKEFVEKTLHEQIDEDILVEVGG